MSDAKMRLSSEKEISHTLHSEFTPVLISAKLLRKYRCGQIDISYIQKGQLVLVEVKSSDIGLAAMRRSQARRLYDSALFLEAVLGMPTKLKFIAKRAMHR